MEQKLAYCGFGVTDVDAWVGFGVEALGLQVVDLSGVKRLRMDDRAWRFALHETKDDDLLYVGFELNSTADLSNMRQRLDAAGIPWTDLKDHECAERQVVGGLWLRDPEGVRLEFVYGHAASPDAFTSSLTEGFVTGDQGLGHVVFSVKDLEASLAFYQKLGFKISDFVTQAIAPEFTLRVAFMHCNARHHSVAMAPLPGPKHLHHVMIELKQVDDVLRGHARCRAMGYATGGIGRHPNDEMLSFYVVSPAGFEVEYGWGGRHIEGEWTIGEYDRISLWGHERPEGVVT